MMFTYNGLKKVKCTLEGTEVVIDGVGYEITCLKETTAEKSMTVMVPVLLGGMAVLLGGEGTREFICGDRVGSLFLLMPFILLIPLTLYLIRYAILQSRCRSLWRINFFHKMYIEKGDDPTIENVLHNLPAPDEATLEKPANQFFTKRDIAVLVVLAIVLLLSFKGVAPDWAALFLPGYAVWLRVRDLLWDLKQQKWQRPTLG
jgi:hypothetical protein